MKRKFKAEISTVRGKTNLPINKVLTIKHEFEADAYIRSLIINEGCEKVEVKVSMYDEEKDEWYIHSEKIHYGPNAPVRDFVLVSEGAHEVVIGHSWCEAKILHVDSRIIFSVNDSAVGYSDGLLEDPEVLFYRFKYTSENGKVYRFTLYCSLQGYGYSEQRLAEIKETILKPGARWYCDHFREKYRVLRGEDAYSKWFQHRDEIEKENKSNK